MNTYNTPTVTLDELIVTINSDYSDSLCFVLTDENTRRTCLSRLVSLPNLLQMPSSLQNAEIIEIRSGEQYKNLETFSWIIEQLTEKRADRKSLLINLGGGVVCDMGGFVAACYKRGIDFINIPTTLLAMVDAAHGGKTGVDFENFKNHIGVFSPATKVVLDVEFLKTLPKSEILSGFAEMIKIALITSVDLWTAIKNANLTNLHSLKPLITETIEKKQTIVGNDPSEKDTRKILNFGHTFGHAFETIALEKGEELSHGHAVAMGILCELWLSETMLNFDANLRQEITDFIFSKYSKYPIQTKDFAQLFDILLHDKKNINQQIKPVLLEQIGQARHDLVCSKELCLVAFHAYSTL